VQLTETTTAVVRRLFDEAEHGVVADVLTEQCGINLPLVAAWTDAEFERLWLAVLKLSDGDLASLRRAVQIAQTDWRDVLVASGFGHSLSAHRQWADRLKT